MKDYGFFHAIFDIVMTICTGGLWLIWIFIKYLRTH